MVTVTGTVTGKVTVSISMIFSVSMSFKVSISIGFALVSRGGLGVYRGGWVLLLALAGAQDGIHGMLGSHHSRDYRAGIGLRVVQDELYFWGLKAQ